MSGPGSVTGWLDRHAAGVRGGGEARLWERYFSRLVALAGQHLRSRARGGDEAEMALSAFDAFVRAGSAGRFPRLGGADDLWRGVLAMAARKAEDASRNPARGKQGG
ncbi:MAG: DNA-directed polymerase specialized sigma subunit, sigma24, partial [Gemmataceae bacterium]|nr:DNA-directed polymerase specialized sigma subunit, sigma24 [Gemmataceae bacterium]